MAVNDCIRYCLYVRCHILFVYGNIISKLLLFWHRSFKLDSIRQIKRKQWGRPTKPIFVQMQLQRPMFIYQIRGIVLKLFWNTKSPFDDFKSSNMSCIFIYFLAWFVKSYCQRKPGYYSLSTNDGWERGRWDTNKIRFGVPEDH